MIAIAHANINSIASENKIDESKQFIVTNNIHIIALTETELDNTVADSQYLHHTCYVTSIHQSSKIGHDVEEEWPSTVINHYLYKDNSILKSEMKSARRQKLKQITSH